MEAEEILLRILFWCLVNTFLPFTEFNISKGNHNLGSPFIQVLKASHEPGPVLGSRTRWWTKRDRSHSRSWEANGGGKGGKQITALVNVQLQTEISALKEKNAVL